jgi:ProP effector
MDDTTPPASPPDPARPDGAACAARLKERFPALFGAAKPMKLRIQLDIQAQAPGEFTKQDLSAFFRRYTMSHAYLVAMSRGTQRYGLDGTPAGELSEEHRRLASEELARRRENRAQREQLEMQQRRNRATLLHDFERTTLTPANFCALKGIAVEELDGLLAIARDEARQPPPPGPHRDRPPQRRPDRPPRGPERPPGPRR